MTNIYNCKYIQLCTFACPNFIKNYLKSRSIAYTRYILSIICPRNKKIVQEPWTTEKYRAALEGLKNYWALWKSTPSNGIIFLHNRNP
jgi:hypothetical protein